MGSQGMMSSPSPLVVKKSRVVIVKPSKATPQVSLSLSTLDNDPYIETLAKTIYVYAPPPPKDVHDPAPLLQDALSHALVYYYPLAGKLHRRSHDHKLELMCTPADGVPFVSATADCTLSSLSYLEDIDDALYELVPSYEAASSGGYNALAVQVTLFACGGLTIATALSHSLCDGFGASQFFKAFTEFAAGKTQPSIIPVWDRHCLTCNNFDFKGQAEEEDEAPKLVDFGEACSSVATSPYTPTQEMVCEILNVTSQDIAQLKDKVTEEVTTLEILAAHVWRARCRALKLSPDGTTLFGMAVGIRRIVEPPLREGYYGNAFVKASVASKAGELSDSPLSRVVKLIKEAKRAALEKRYVWEQLKETEKSLKMKAMCEGGNGAFMLLTDWRQLGLLDEVDFGYGGSVNIIPLVPKYLSDICVFLPRKHGGVRVLVTLPKAAMDNFKEYMMNPLS